LPVASAVLWGEEKENLWRISFRLGGEGGRPLEGQSE